MSKQDVLKLNAMYIPLGVENWRKVFTDIVSGSAHPVDVTYYQNKHGEVDLEKVESLTVVKDFDEWATLPVRPYDDYVNTPNRVFRVPPIVVYANFKHIIHKQMLFPTKNNIWKRDNYTCAYTGKKLTRDEVSVDHIIPKSRGGKNTWENLITAQKAINVFKADRTPQEAGLELLFKPYRPNNGFQTTIRDEWKIFLDVEKFK
jgi:5-methylcytosine-specific restriction endonuclease McrA